MLYMYTVLCHLVCHDNGIHGNFKTFQTGSHHSPVFYCLIYFYLLNPNKLQKCMDINHKAVWNVIKVKIINVEPTRAFLLT